MLSIKRLVSELPKYCHCLDLDKFLVVTNGSLKVLWLRCVSIALSIRLCGFNVTYSTFPCVFLIIVFL